MHVTVTIASVSATLPGLTWGLNDSDNDGIINAVDECPHTPNGTPVDSGGCGCRDSDGGIKTNRAGRAHNVEKSSNAPAKSDIDLAGVSDATSLTHVDTCVDNDTLREYYCNDSQKVDSKSMDCQVGCVNGACICNDGDGGLVYNKTGVFRIESGSGVGHSSEGGHITTSSGQSVYILNTQYAPLLDAASLSPNTYFTLGDYCVSDTVLKEFYCDDNGSIVSLNHICQDKCENGRCVTIPNLRMLFLPVKWNGTQQSFNNAVQTQINSLINAIPLKDCPEEMEVVKLNLSDELKNFDCFGEYIPGHVESLGINRADYDIVVGLSNLPLCLSIVGTSNGVDTLWVYNKYDSLLSHEFGHLFGLSDQYCSNLAGATDSRCNDGGPPHGGTDVNYLDDEMPYDCPPQGTVDSNGKDCCNFYENVFMNVTKNCSGLSYGICCLGNNHGGGGRSVMTFANVDLFSPGPRAFDGHEKAHLATIPQLKCGSAYAMFSPLAAKLFNLSTLADEEIATVDFESASESAYYKVGYSGNITPDRIVVVDLDVGKDDKVFEREVILREGRPTMTSGKDGSYHLMVVDSGGQELWSTLFNLYFDYGGPMELGVDYSNIKYKSRPVSYRIPYFLQMREVRLYHDGRIIYSKKLDFCVRDGVCGVTETAQTCPEDCRPDSNDKVCNPASDDICDPDCNPKKDPDCQTMTQNAQRIKTQESKDQGCVPLLPAPIVLLAAGLAAAVGKTIRY